MPLGHIVTTPFQPKAPVAPAAATSVATPTFTGGIDFVGTGRFTKFSAHATNKVYGETGGYATLQEAIDGVTFLTVGSREAAAGIFEQDGRFYARGLDNDVTFANGATWKGVWRLEQFPADLELLDGSAKGTTTRADALKAILRQWVQHVPARTAR